MCEAEGSLEIPALNMVETPQCMADAFAYSNGPAGSPLGKSLFFYSDPAPTEIYTLSLHDALPIYNSDQFPWFVTQSVTISKPVPRSGIGVDRKSTRLNSSHMSISYAVFCLKK